MKEEELEHFIAYFKITKINKRQFIIQPDFVARYRSYVPQGAFRGYVIGDAGQDHTIQFAVGGRLNSRYFNVFNCCITSRTLPSNFLKAAMCRCSNSGRFFVDLIEDSYSKPGSIHEA